MLSQKIEKLIRWLNTHDVFEQEVPKNLQYPGWCSDVYVALSKLAIIEHNDKTYDLLNDFHEAVIVNAVFCWAMKQPRCPEDSLCTLCNKPARNTNVIVRTCKSHPTQGMHIICLLNAIANPCPLCHKILYDLTEVSKYAYCKHTISNNQCISVQHINGERRIQYTSADGKTVYTAENLIEKCGIQTIQTALCTALANRDTIKFSSITPDMRFKGWLDTIVKDPQKIINSGEKTLKFYEIYVWPAVENYIHSLRHFDKDDAVCYICGNSNKILLAPCWYFDGICEKCLRTLINNEQECPICHRPMFDLDLFETFI